jgi:ABC-2 type transport system permease protein
MSFSSFKKFVTSKRFKFGGYAIAITLVGIAVVVLVNIGLTVLENNFDLRLDLTQNKAYSLNEQTKKVVGNLTKDVYIYTLYTPGNENDEVNAVLMKIKALSGHVTLENRDPNRDPAFMKKFQENGSSTIAEGSVIVADKEGKLFRVIDQYAQYSYGYNSYTQSYETTQLKVEGAVTTAVNYIELGYIPTVFLVQGHGEVGLTDLSHVQAGLSDESYSLKTINIAQAPGDIKPGDIVMFFNPQRDITDLERETLKPLMEKGGRFLFLFDPTSTETDKLPNLMSLLKLYDIDLKPGIVYENDSLHMYSPSYPYVLAPDIQSHDITNAIIQTQIPILVDTSGALKLPEAMPDSSMTMQPLLKTTGNSFLKTLEELSLIKQDEKVTKSDTDESGPFTVAAAVERDARTGDVNDNVRFVVAYNTRFISNSDIALKFENYDLFINSMAWMRNSEKDIYVRPKTVSTPQITIRSAAQFWAVSVVSVLLVPVVMVIAGIVIYLKRKHL